MTAAANEERELVLYNEVINEISHIAITGEGSWMKKSYRTEPYFFICEHNLWCENR